MLSKASTKFTPASVQDILANNIKAIAEALRRLDEGPLNKRAIVLLIAESSGQSRTAVNEVLDAIRTLDSTYLAKRK